MVKNNGIPIEVKKPFETVYEIKNEFPSFEEFMKTYEHDDKVVKSYEDELEAKAVQGSQYGPGKSDFKGICRKIRDELGYTISCKISCDSDYFYESHKYSGVIVYLMNGKTSWQVEKGRACGRNGRSFYMIVRDTTDWDWKYPERRGIGGGVYHGWIVKDEFGHDLGVKNSNGDYVNRDIRSNNIICCGGFAWLPDRSPCLQYHSCTLNIPSQVGGDTEGTNDLSYEEKKLVDFCFKEYRDHGPNYIIPDTYYSMSF